MWGLLRALFLFRWLSRACPGGFNCLLLILAWAAIIFFVLFIWASVTSN